MKSLFYLLLAAIISIPAVSQQVKVPGQFSGSFESFTQIYQPDSAINALVPQDRIGSNNYLKLDYNYGPFSAGVQFESYLPSVAGFPFIENKSALVHRYFRYSRERFSVQVGNFYEQFGSGLILRTWENRQIGINNSLEGANIQVEPFNFMKVKAVYGRMRKVFDYSASNIRGLDAEFDLSQLSKTPPAIRVMPGFSYVSKFEEYTGPEENFPTTIQSYSGRLNIESDWVSTSIEYISKGSDPQLTNGMSREKGHALLWNASVTGNNLGVNLTVRELENMLSRSERMSESMVTLMNYVPALTKQHEFLTTNIYVYNAQALGELGGQLDFFYNFEKGSAIGGKHGANLGINLSHYSGLKEPGKMFSTGGEKYFHDFNVELKKHWSDKLQTLFLYQNVFYNKAVIEGGLYDDVLTNAFVANSIYRLTKTKTLRLQAEHLWTEQDRGNWAAALAEFSFAPTWIFTLGDLYNYGVTKLHYPYVGASYTRGGTKIAVTYGRQRAGMFCAGGICRLVPATTGFNITLTSRFSN